MADRLNFSGVVGKFSPPNRLNGWVKYRGITEPAEIVVTFGDEIIASGLAMSVREKSASNNEFIKFGFSIFLSKRLSKEQISSDILKVTAKVNSEKFVLRKSENLRATASAGTTDFAKQVQRKLCEDETTEIKVVVGTQSDDGVSVIGNDGFIFLVGGSNNVQQMYSKRDDGVSEQWLSLVKERAELLSGQEIEFLQIIVPEKSTVLHRYFPGKIRVPSSTYANLKEKISLHDNLSEKVIFFDSVVAKSDYSQNPEKLFRKTDTHLTSSGAELLFNATLSCLGISVDYEIKEKYLKVQTCDLGSKFLEITPVENVEFFSSLHIRELEMMPDLIHERLPESGHQGTVRVYVNENAPIDRKVLVFANSFFWGGGSSLGQCWWFSRFFKEFHFVWSANIDINYIENISPDIVISQSIERFLKKLPFS